MAVIDVGTNTVLYLRMARVGGRDAETLEEGIAPTRLGAGLAAGEPSAGAITKTIDAIGRFLEDARVKGTDDVLVVGTEVLRRGPWRRDFLAAVRARFGVNVDVLAPEEEGQLVLLAARRSLALGLKAIVAVDLGGGSAQIIREGRRGRRPRVDTYPLGCVFITERFFGGGDGPEAWQEAQTFIRNELASIPRVPADTTLVLAGGTAAALASIELSLVFYTHDRVHGYKLRRAAVTAWGERIYRLSLPERKEIPGMPEGRADIFPAGALALGEIMSALGCDEAIVSAQGVRFGLAYRYFDGEGQA